MGYDDICMAADELQAQFGVTRSVRCDVEQVQIPPWHKGQNAKTAKAGRAKGTKGERQKRQKAEREGAPFNWPK